MNTTELVKRFILQAFDPDMVMEQHKTDDISKRFRLHSCTKYQELEMPGPAAEGRLWVALQAMVHCYHYHPEKGSKCGMQIWKKRQFIFCPSSLLEDEARSTYISPLEHGPILSIGYPDLRDLMGRYHQVDTAIRSFALKQEHYYRKKSQLLNACPLERVRQFRAQNQAFINCSTQEVQAMHVNMSLRSYINQVNKLK